MRRRTALLASIALAAVPASASAADPPEHALGVMGQGTVEVQPDQGTFQAGVERTARTSAAARNATNVRLNRIVGRLRALGVARADITTTSVSLDRRRTRDPRTKRVRIAYAATGSFGVVLRDVTRIGRALDAAAGAGATGFDGPSFSFSAARRTEGRRQAEAAALGDARARADAAAASQGQRVVGVRSIELDPSGTSEPSGTAEGVSGSGSSSSAGKTAATPILPGREAFESAVRVVYVIAPTG